MLKLWFSASDPAQLDKIQLSWNGSSPRISIRGRDRGAYLNSAQGTFPWCKGVRGLAVLCVGTMLASLKNSVPFVLAGERGSIAFALDSSIAKETRWVCELFGVDGNGRSLARRLLLRSNPEGKRPGPISILINERYIAEEKIAIFRGDDEVSSESALTSLLQILQEQKASSAGASVRIGGGRTLSNDEGCRVIPTERACYFSNLTDYVIECLSLEGILSQRQISSWIHARPMHPLFAPQFLSHTIDRLISQEIVIQNSLGYSLADVFVQRRGEIFHQVEQLAQMSRGPCTRENHNLIRIEFASLAQMDAFLSPLYSLCIGYHTGEKTAWWHLHQSTWPLLRPQKMVVDGPIFKNTRYLNSGASSVDRWVQSFFSKLGVIGTLGTPLISDNDFWVIDDIYVQQQLPERLQTAIETFFLRSSGIANFDNIELQRGYYDTAERCSVTVSILPGFTEGLRRYLPEFEYAQRKVVGI